MATYKLEPTRWQQYFDDVSKHGPAAKLKVEVLAPTLGDQLQAERRDFEGISYDPTDASLVITTEAVEHRITNPREIYVDEELGRLSSLQVIDESGTKQIVRLTPALELPPA